MATNYQNTDNEVYSTTRWLPTIRIQITKFILRPDGYQLSEYI